MVPRLTLQHALGFQLREKNTDIYDEYVPESEQWNQPGRTFGNCLELRFASAHSALRTRSSEKVEPILSYTFQEERIENLTLACPREIYSHGVQVKKHSFLSLPEYLLLHVVRTGFEAVRHSPFPISTKIRNH